MLTESVKENRSIFLAALRSGVYPKGPYIKNQDKPPEGATGFCAVGLAYTLFLDGEDVQLTKRFKEVLNLSQKQLAFIQNEWNDSPLTFPEIADKIELDMFQLPNCNPESE